MQRGQDNPVPRTPRRLDVSTSSRLRVYLRRLVPHRLWSRSSIFLGKSGCGENNPVMDGIHLQHLQLDCLPFLHRIARLLNVRNSELRHRDESFDVTAEIDDDAFVHQPHHAAAQLRADGIRLSDAQPRVLLGLLETQRDPLVLGIDVQNQDVDFVALFHDFRRMLHALGPRHVGDVDQPVDARLDFDERTERGQVADLAAQPRADGILLRQCHPRILLRLLHAERDFFFGLIDFQHDRFDRLADGDELRRMPYVAGPAHLGDVHEPFNPRLQLHERAVVRNRHDLALHPRSNRILRGDILPRIRLQLLEAERNALALPVDVENLDLELLADLHHLGGMRHAAVAHVGDVQQAVDAAEIDERAEVGDVLDDTFADLLDRQLLHQHVALRLALRLDPHPARHHDVATPFVQLDDLELEALAEQLVDVRHTAQRNLAAGEERIHAHEIHDHAALDLLHQRAGDRFVFFVRFPDLLPDAHEVGLLLRQDDGAFLVLEVLEEDLDLVAFLQTLRILEFVDRDRAFGLEADVENDGGVGHAQHFRFDDFTFFDIRERPLVQQSHSLDLVGGVFLIETRADAEW